uniref:Serine protease n=1 Tax=Chromera velia CCMP2878 TaxID=1169474 RepID=A0A0G4HY36_9ALVE|eukprot:Cvel_9401.t1-p1 / transcript=Cvel_9401.t1 / gene=Cvel_9401 / organism=Chromera_velia_CCMP2878 / gene_product=hypothetical protein / transcript_product=hypothetical protein / location=Cvel_scaffold540:26957-31705(+) / protein_length=929 / sequence_SO=supercontig / SO=protein_coding / is_pseudo=false
MTACNHPWNGCRGPRRHLLRRPSSFGLLVSTLCLVVETGNVPWNDALLPFRANEMLWHDDSRRDPTRMSEPLQATVAIIRRDRGHVERQTGTGASTGQAQETGVLVLANTTLAERMDAVRLSGGRGMRLCDSVAFRDQPRPAHCTGVLVAEDIVATAAHCIPTSSAARRFFFVFGFNTAEAEAAGGESLLRIPMSNVYEASEVIFSEFGNSQTRDRRGNDFSLVRLDRNVEGRTPARGRTGGRVRGGQTLYLIGHPVGLSAKTTKPLWAFSSAPSPFLGSSAAPIAGGMWDVHGGVPDGRILHEGDASFKVTLDAFGGNSGSPVFDLETDALEGLVVRGDSDWIQEEAEGGGICFREARCPSDRGARGADRGVILCEGETVLRSTEFAGILQLEERRKRLAENSVEVAVEADGGKGVFPLSVPDLGSRKSPVELRFPFSSLLLSTPPPALPFSGPSPIKSQTHESGAVPSLQRLLSVDVSLDSSHTASTCELEASLSFSPSNSDINSTQIRAVPLGTLCEETAVFRLDTETLPLASLLGPLREEYQTHESDMGVDGRNRSAPPAWVLRIRDTARGERGEVKNATMRFVFSHSDERNVSGLEGAARALHRGHLRGHAGAQPEPPPIDPLTVLQGIPRQTWREAESLVPDGIFSPPVHFSFTDPSSVSELLHEGSSPPDGVATHRRRLIVTDWKLRVVVKQEGGEGAPSPSLPSRSSSSFGAFHSAETGAGGRQQGRAGNMESECVLYLRSPSPLDAGREYGFRVRLPSFSFHPSLPHPSPIYPFSNTDALAQGQGSHQYSHARGIDAPSEFASMKNSSEGVGEGLGVMLPVTGAAESSADENMGLEQTYGGTRRSRLSHAHGGLGLGEFVVNLGGAGLNERHRLFFYGVDPVGVWDLRGKPNQGAGERTGEEALCLVVNATLTLMVAETR